MSNSAQRRHVLWYPELKADLVSRDIPHATLAAEVGCATQTISHILRGRVNPSSKLRQRIADYLERDVDELWTENTQVRHLTESRTAQGHPATITDPAILRRAVTLAGGGHDDVA